eukprot:7973-Heterococcus_DN1.PRE.2
MCESSNASRHTNVQRRAVATTARVSSLHIPSVAPCTTASSDNSTVLHTQLSSMSTLLHNDTLTMPLINTAVCLSSSRTQSAHCTTVLTVPCTMHVQLYAQQSSVKSDYRYGLTGHS